MRNSVAIRSSGLLLGVALFSAAVPVFGQTSPPGSDPPDTSPQNVPPHIESSSPRIEPQSGAAQAAQTPTTSAAASTSVSDDNPPGWTTEWVEDGRLRVVSVDPNSLAAELGLRAGDEIIKISGRDVKPGDNVDQLLTVHTNQRLSMVVLRDGERRTIHVFPEVRPQAAAVFDRRRGQPTDLGMLLRGREAVFITGVHRGSPAEQAGLLAGDELLSVNGRRYYSSSDFAQALGQFVQGDRVRVQIVRNNRVQDVLVPLVDSPQLSETRDVRLTDPEAWRGRATESRAYRPGVRASGPIDDASREELFAGDDANTLREMQQHVAALRNEVDALRAEIAALRREIASRGNRVVR